MSAMGIWQGFPYIAISDGARQGNLIIAFCNLAVRGVHVFAAILVVHAGRLTTSIVVMRDDERCHQGPGMPSTSLSATIPMSIYN